MKFIAKIVGKEIVFERKNVAEDFLAKMDGKTVLVTVENPPRSDKQNKMYWGLVLNAIVQAIHESTGQDKDDIHGYFKAKFLSKTMYINGKLVPSIKSTTKLTTSEFSRYIEQIKAEAATEFGIQVPETYEIQNLLEQ
jgi:hypothetical protein